MKRKHDSDDLPADKKSKRPHLSSAVDTANANADTDADADTDNGTGAAADIYFAFRPDLFQPQALTSYRLAYRQSEPYHHGVIPTLISDTLLRAVRTEILTHISFSPKETDIYKIQQSGDLANLDGLDSAQLAHLPSLVNLRDALYSPKFRGFLEAVTGAGKLSGKKTDMAINIYTPGSYLLCHDDVIGTRRVSYILYLTDPDEPWQPQWGGGLRLYATEIKTNEKSEEVKVPMPEHVKVIAPSWGQLSFFAVQPGESFHDVEEVYHPSVNSEGEAKKRVRMAISGWYHIPQEDEDGYEEGLEQKLAERSSLGQLQGKEADEFDEPHSSFIRFDQAGLKDSSSNLEAGKDATPEADQTLLSESDLDFLLQYISPSYLTPEMAEQLASSFEENSVLQLDRFLCDKFATAVKEFVLRHDERDPSSDSEENECREWETARPPHKHRFLFQQMSPETGSPLSESTVQQVATVQPISALLNKFFSSRPFRKWLSIVTDLKIEGDACLDLLARRFRRGKDYALASGHEGERPRLEFCLGVTPTDGWEAGPLEDVRGGEDGGSEIPQRTAGDHGTFKAKEATQQHVEFGGEEIYMAADDEDVDEDDAGEEDIEAKPSPNDSSALRPPKKSKSDPAIYRSAKIGEGEEEEDAILFTDAPSWNRFSIVLRDKGTLRFVKYVSRAAKGDRWDIKGVVVAGEGGWGEDEDEEGEGEREGVESEEEETEHEEGEGDGGEGAGEGEEEFKGFVDESEEEEVEEEDSDDTDDT